MLRGMSQRITGHAGEQALAALRPFGVDVMFTLNGGHVWPLYDAARNQGVRVVDTRHEQTATFAAEAYAKLTRTPGLAVLTAGPGVTNGISAITSAHFNGTPLVVLGGRAPQRRWGSGSLQELDHVPIVASITKSAGTVFSPELAAKQVHEAALAAVTPHRGPVFLDFPLDVFGPAEAELPDPVEVRGPEPDLDAVDRVAAMIAAAERPAAVLGSDVYWEGAWESWQRAAERLQLPCYFNGLGRGCLPADHPLAFTRTRGPAQDRRRPRGGRRHGARLPARLRPLRRRQGRAHRRRAREHLAAGRADETLVGMLGAVADRLAEYQDRVAHEAWIETARERESAARASDDALFALDADPIKPTRVYGELIRRLERDAVVICDGGDFASYAGKYIDVFTPGCWLDTGPYGCLGNGPGYAIAARVARPGVAGRRCSSATARRASA